MAKRSSPHGTIIAIVAGAGVMLWWLLRSGGTGKAHAGTQQGPSSTTTPPRSPCQVVVRQQRIDVDGTPEALPAVVARCREAGRADVRVTGDAVVRTIGDVVRALQAAGVDVIASPSVWASANAPRLDAPGKP